MFTDDALRVEITIGKEGVQFVHEEDGFYIPTPEYVEGSVRRIAGYDNYMTGPGFWAAIAPSDELYNSTISTDKQNGIETYGDPATVLTDAFYKVDIVPSGSTYVVDLQKTKSL